MVSICALNEPVSIRAGGDPIDRGRHIHSREIENNGAEKRLMAVVLNNCAFPGTRVVPRSLTGTDASKVLSPAGCFLGVVDQGGIDDGGVWVQITFLEAV